MTIPGCFLEIGVCLVYVTVRELSSRHHQISHVQPVVQLVLVRERRQVMSRSGCVVKELRAVAR